MRLIWSKLAAWRLFFLGKDLVLHFKQFRFDGATFFNYIQHSKMQHFCSIFQLTRCIRESWLNVVFVVCSLGENLLIDLFFKYLKKQTLLIFWASRLVKMYSLTSFLNTWKTKLCSFFEFPAWWKCTHWHLLTKLEAFESSKLKKLEKQTLFILWAHRLVEIHSLTSFDKSGGFWKL